MSSLLKAALEAQIIDQELEIEYSYFLKVTQEQLDKLLNSGGVSKSLLFSESKLSKTARIRHYLEKDGDQFELTTKTKSDVTKGKIEDNDEICLANYNTLLAMSNSTVVRNRLYIPVIVGGEPVKREDGSPLQWEVDLYIDARNVGNGGSNLTHPWIKIELEVDKATLPNVIKYIPFEYDELIHSDSTDEVVRAFIGNLYDNDYNVQGVYTADTLRLTFNK